MVSVFRRFCVALIVCYSAAAGADTIQIHNVGLEATDTRYVLNADCKLELSPPLLEALNNGLSLSFLVEFELARPRWYWFDEKTASETLELRLAYLPLAQQYRLSSGTMHQNFATITEALAALGTVYGWPVLDRDQLDNGRKYVASVRMRLDTARLPTPFRVSAVTNREWTLVSEWKKFPFTPLAPVLEAR